MFATNDFLLIELASGRLDVVWSGICAYVVGMRFQRIIGPAVDTDPIRLEKQSALNGNTEFWDSISN